jgi:7-carboxy-7-deazaguanine synthase
LLKICEIYRSVQGEGVLTGTPSVFVRTSGCNLRCGFCDTPYASWEPEGQVQSVAEILASVRQWDCRHTVITGGEPMVYEDLVELNDRLREHGLHTTIETAGTVDLSVDADLMSISPKLTNSTPPEHRAGAWQARHESTRHRPEIVGRLVARARDYQIKFVVDQPEDLDEIATYLMQTPGVQRQRVLLMPQGTTAKDLAERAGWLVPWCAEHGYRYCDRAQIHWFGSKRGT